MIQNTENPRAVRVFVSPALTTRPASRRQPIVGWIHVQHTSITVAFARWKFLFLGLKTIKSSSAQVKSLLVGTHLTIAITRSI